MLNETAPYGCIRCGKPFGTLKAVEAMLGKLAAGDEVITSGGIVGKITEISDNFITIEISEGVRIKVQRFHVTSLVPKGTLKGA